MDDRARLQYCPPRGRRAGVRMDLLGDVLSRMPRVDGPGPFGPAEAPSWFRGWSSVRDQPDLTIGFEDEMRGPDGARRDRRNEALEQLPRRIALPARGPEGLFLLSSMADRLHGDLWIASGDALLVRRTEGERRVEEIVPTAGWGGAWLCLDAPVPGW